MVRISPIRRWGPTRTTSDILASARPVATTSGPHDLAKTDCAVIYLTETLAKDMADVLDRYKDNIQPAIILIPVSSILQKEQ